MVTTTAHAAQPGAGWLRSENYDTALIAGVAILALCSGGVVLAEPKLFALVLLADLWFLGYHHVISTYTRLAFDRKSVHEYRFFLFYLPPLVFGATFLVAWQFGIWVVASIYLYWQWFHYTRQSWGISRVYRAKSGGLVTEGPWLSHLAFYLPPLYGILYRSWQAPEAFLFQELRVIPVAGWVVDIVGLLALASVAVWALGRFRAWRQGMLARASTYFMISHFVVFLVGYRLIPDITIGWLVINVWHNAQYILFVWLFNTNRFSNGKSDTAPFLSALCQPEKKLAYFAVCFGISTLIYLAITALTHEQFLLGLPLFILAYQTINFHHYIVDAFIWKVRKKPLRKTLGLPSEGTQ